MNRIAFAFTVILPSLAASGQTTAPRVNQLGSYGPWLADQVLGDGPARLSFRTGKWKNVAQWRQAARKRALECIAPVNLGGLPEVTVTGRTTYDGVDIEFLTWQLPAGPKTEAVLLKPAGARGPLPGILALHDHGGNKFLGWRKITRTDSTPWAIQEKHQATLLWRRGLGERDRQAGIRGAGSRHVSFRQPQGEGGGCAAADPGGRSRSRRLKISRESRSTTRSPPRTSTSWKRACYRRGRRGPESTLWKTSGRWMFCAAGRMWMPPRIGCAGLSGGGMRTVFLGGLDDRIKVAVAVGFMTTWREFLLDKSFTHTWMTYVPLLPKDLDFPEILALRAPAATMVLNCREDPLYTLPEMQRADAMIAETFKRAQRLRAVPGQSTTTAATSSTGPCRRMRSTGSTAFCSLPRRSAETAAYFAFFRYSSNFFLLASFSVGYTP